METATETDVAIIGYGPVGVTAANLLGKLGMSVVVLERDADVHGRARAIATEEEVIRIWQSVGLAEEVKADMLTGLPIDFVDAQGKCIMALQPQPRGMGHPTQLFLYQPALERVLRRGVERFPTVDVRLGFEVISRKQDADGVDLVALRLEDDTLHRVRAKYVIAADGGSSPTRAALGVGYEGTTYEDRWIVIDAKVKKPWPEIGKLRFHCDPSRPTVDCPTPLGHHRWEFPVLPGDDEKELVTEAAVLKLLSRLHISAEHVDILRAVTYSHHVRFAAKWRVGRIFLAGDAAHAMPPWIGEGMSSGVRDALNLSWKVAAVIRGQLPDSILDTYEIERQPHVRELTQVAVNFGRIITERNRALTSLRDLLLRVAMKTPRLGKWIHDGNWFPPPHYDRGYFASSPEGPGKPQGADGWLPVQPRVLANDGVRVLLDDALPDGWVVVTTRADRDRSMQSWVDAGVPVIELVASGDSSAERLVDATGDLRHWLKGKGVDTVALRPDRYTYASRREDALPAPPFLRQASVAAPEWLATTAGHHDE